MPVGGDDSSGEAVVDGWVCCGGRGVLLLNGGVLRGAAAGAAVVGAVGGAVGLTLPASKRQCSDYIW